MRILGRIETETRLRLLLTNQSPYKIESYKGQVKIIKVADWAEVYVLFCSLVGYGKIETTTKERGCLFTANGLSLECFCSNRKTSIGYVGMKVLELKIHL